MGWGSTNLAWEVFSLAGELMRLPVSTLLNSGVYAGLTMLDEADDFSGEMMFDFLSDF